MTHTPNQDVDAEKDMPGTGAEFEPSAEPNAEYTAEYIAEDAADSSPAPSVEDSVEDSGESVDTDVHNDAAYLVRVRKRQSALLGVSWVVGGGLIAAVAATSLIAPPPAPEPLPATRVSAHPSQLTLGCLDASIDPFAPLGSEEASTNAQRDNDGQGSARTAAATLWHPTGSSHTDFLLGGEVSPEPPARVDGRSWALTSTLSHTNDHVDASAVGSANSELPHGVSLLAQKGGELRGLSLLPCTPPALEHWFAAGATSAGEDTIIRVANTGSQPSVVTLSAWGASGPLDELSQGEVVGAGETLTIQPGRYFSNEERLLIRLQADGPGVSAWLHSSAISGEIPQGAAWIGSTVPSSRILIPGLTAQGTHSLRIAVPAASGTTADTTGPQSDGVPAGTQVPTDTQVTVRLIDAEGTRDIPGGTLSLAANSVLDLDLPSMTETSTLLVESTQPVVAQIRALFPGTQWPSGSTQTTPQTSGESPQQWVGRGLLAPATPIQQLTIPAATDMEASLTRAFDAAIVRPTSVTTPAQSSIAGQELLLINPTMQELSADYGDDKITIPAGTSVTLPIADSQRSLGGDEGLHAAILIHIDMPTGNVNAVWPLGNVAMSGLTRAIDLR